jgi:hypothetical protein
MIKKGRGFSSAVATLVILGVGCLAESKQSMGLAITNTNQYKVIEDRARNLAQQSKDVIYRSEFKAKGQSYWFFATRNTDGSVALYISRPNFSQPIALSQLKIYNEFIRKIVKKANSDTTFVLVVAGGNGWSPDMVAYKLDLSNPNSPLLTSLSILQQRGVLKDGDPVLSSDGGLYHTHTFRGDAGQSITITLGSQRAFDHYLEVIAPDGKKIAESYGTKQNDPYKDRTSELTITLPLRGSYRVIVNGRDRNSRGAYTLSINSNS